IGLSVAALVVALDRAIYLLRTGDNVRQLAHDTLGLLARGELDAARKRLARSRSFEARIVASGLASPEDGAASAEERMAGATQAARLGMERRLAFLGTLGVNAPFLGLLGT